MTDLEATAIAGLEAAFGSGTPAASGLAPGRTTLLGEHVDYVGGRVACMAIDLALAVAVRPSADARWRVVSGGERVEREGPGTARDIGDRVFAAASALGRFGVLLPPLDIGVASQLPRSSGLSSSAALTAASLVAMLRLARARLGADDLVAAALIAEREIVGVPCGDLDPLAVVHGRADAVLLLDCATGARETRAWPWPEIRLIVAGSGERHDVQGAGYRARREQAERACALLGATGCQEIAARSPHQPEPCIPEPRPAGQHRPHRRDGRRCARRPGLLRRAPGRRRFRGQRPGPRGSERSGCMRRGHGGSRGPRGGDLADRSLRWRRGALAGRRHRSGRGTEERRK
ncbi:MAG: galactokinase family protein [Candidatus Dormibacteria bacterium]